MLSWEASSEISGRFWKVVKICDEGEWPSLALIMSNSSDGAEAESGIAAPFMWTLSPVTVEGHPQEMPPMGREAGNGQDWCYHKHHCWGRISSLGTAQLIDTRKSRQKQ